MRIETVGLVAPAHLQSSPEFLVCHVQVALDLLNARVAESTDRDGDGSGDGSLAVSTCGRHRQSSTYFFMTSALKPEFAVTALAIASGDVFELS